MKLLVSFALLALVLAVGSSHAAPLPGLTSTTSKAGIETMLGFYTRLLRSEWSSLSSMIPPIPGNITYPVLGTLDYEVTDVTLLPDPVLPNPTVYLDPGVGFIVYLSGATFSFTMDFTYNARSWGMNGTGTANVTIVNLNMDIGGILLNKNGRLFLEVSKSDTKIGDMKIVLGGGASWLQSWVTNLKSYIISDLEYEVSNMTWTYADQFVNQAFQSAPVKTPIAKVAEMDVSLVSDPIFTSSSMSIMVKGEVTAINQTARAPFTPLPMPYILTKDMSESFISDYLINTATFALLQGGLLQYNITDTDIPSWSPIRLNTATWAFVLPQLALKYPNMEMVATAAVTQAPLARFTQLGLNETASGTVTLSVLPKNAAAIPVFIIGFNVSVTLHATLNATLISGKIVELLPQVYQKWSSVGDLPLSILNTGIQMLTSTLVPMANTVLEQGYKMPAMPDGIILNPTIVFGQNFMDTSMSISFKSLFGRPSPTKASSAIAIN